MWRLRLPNRVLGSRHAPPPNQTSVQQTGRMTVVDISDAEAQLARLVERARGGETIVISQAGVPMAELCAVGRATVVLGGLAGRIDVDYAAFDDADAEIAEMWNRDPRSDAP